MTSLIILLDSTEPPVVLPHVAITTPGVVARRDTSRRYPPQSTFPWASFTPGGAQPSDQAFSLGPRPPVVTDAVLTVPDARLLIAVHLTAVQSCVSLIGTRQQHWRLFGPTRVIIVPPTQQQQTIMTALTAVRQPLAHRRARRTFSVPPAPVVVSPAVVFSAFPPVLTAVRSRRSLIGTRQQHWRLSGPVLVFAPIQPPIRLELATQDTRAQQLRRRAHSSLPIVLGSAAAAIAPPITTNLVTARPPATRFFLPVFIAPASAAVFAPPSVHLAGPVSARLGRRSFYRLAPPNIRAATSVITTRLVATRPRHTRSFLTYVVYPSTSKIAVALVRSRPRPTRRFLTAVTYPSTSTILVALARTRPRPTRPLLKPPIFYPQTSRIAVALVHTRPRPTRSHLAPPPSVLQVFGPPVEIEVSIKTALERPRVAPHSRLSAPIFYPATSEISVSLARIRPRLTHYSLTAVRYPATSEVAVSLTRTRPRPTRKFLTSVVYRQTSVITVKTALRPRLDAVRRLPRSRLSSPPYPLAVFGPPVEVEIAVRTPVDDRQRRLTHSRLSPPHFYPQTTTITVALVQTRPRHVISKLSAISYPESGVVFEAEVSVRTPIERPRHAPHYRLSPPVFYPATSEITTRLVQTRPRPTRSFLTDVSYPQAGQVSVSLVRTRPRQTRFSLTYVVYPATSSINATTVRTRPRPTRTFLSPPVTLRVFTGPRVALAVKSRGEPLRRVAVSFFRGPLVVYPLPTLRVQTIQATCVAVASRVQRVRVVGATLAPPATLIGAPPVAQPIRVWLASLRATDFLRRRPHVRVEPPTAVIPLPSQRAQTISVSLAAVRTRVEQGRHVQHSRLAAPVRYPQTSKLAVALVHTRPRPTVSSLSSVVYPQTSEITVTTVRTRPRPTRHFLNPPTTLVVFGPPSEHQIAVRIPVEDRQRRGVHSRLSPPKFYAATSEIIVSTVRTRPRPTTVFLTDVRYAASGGSISRLAGRTRVEDQRRAARSHFTKTPITRPEVTSEIVALALPSRGRPHSRLAPPTVVSEPSKQQTTVAVTLVAERTRVESLRRAPHSRLSPPATLVPPSAPLVTTLTVVSTAIANRLARVHQVVHPVLRRLPFRARGTRSFALPLSAKVLDPRTKVVLDGPTVAVMVAARTKVVLVDPRTVAAVVLSRKGEK